MQIITRVYRSKSEIVKDNDIDRMMKSFQAKMKQRYRIPPVLIEKYKNELCFMVEMDKIYMEDAEPNVKFIEPMGYKMSEELIEGYAQIILQSEKEIEFLRWGTYKKKVREVHSELHSKEIKKKVEKKIDRIRYDSRGV